MKKVFLFFVLLFIPFVVSAEEVSDIVIKDLVFQETTGYTEVLEEGTIVDNKITLNLKMYEVGDSATYTFKVQNNTNTDYLVDEKNLKSSNSALEYQLETKDHSYIVDKNSEKEFTLITTYQNEVERTSFKAGKFDASNIYILDLVDPTLINPSTRNYFISILFLLFVVFIGMIFVKNKNIKVCLFIITFLIPLSVFALNVYQIEIDSNIIIGYVTPNPCTYDGELIQGAEYVNGQYTYRYMQESTGRNWKNISSDGWGVHLSDSTLTDPVTSRLCTSINEKPIVSMSNMFYNSQTTSIDTSSFDTSNVVNMSYMFYNLQGLSNLDLVNFDTSSVTDMSSMFYNIHGLRTVDVSSFDTRNVTSFSGMFEYVQFEELDTTNFDTRNGRVSSFIKNSSLKKFDASNLYINNTDTRNFFVSGGFEEFVSPMYVVSNCRSHQISPKMYDEKMRCYQNLTGMPRKTKVKAYTNYYYVSLNTKGGTVDVSGKMVPYSDPVYGELPIPVRPGREFLGWAKSNGTVIQPTDAVTEDVSLYAKWSEPEASLDSGDIINQKMKCLANLSDSQLSSCSSSYNKSTVDSNIKKIKRSKILPNISLDSYHTISYDSPTPVYIWFDTDTIYYYSTSDFITMYYSSSSMFKNMTSLEEIDLDSFDTGSVVYFYNMFEGDTSLTELDLSTFNVDSTYGSGVDYMFKGCTNLKKLDISSWDMYNWSSFPTNLFSEVSLNYLKTPKAMTGKTTTSQTIPLGQNMIWEEENLVYDALYGNVPAGVWLKAENLS